MCQRSDTNINPKGNVSPRVAACISLFKYGSSQKNLVYFFHSIYLNACDLPVKEEKWVNQ